MGGHNEDRDEEDWDPNHLPASQGARAAEATAVGSVDVVPRVGQRGAVAVHSEARLAQQRVIGRLTSGDGEERLALALVAGQT